MLDALVPLSSRNLFVYIVQPHIEGAERINRAFWGIDSHSLAQSRLTMKERVVSLIAGLVLTFFVLVNNIVWIAWQVLGHPETLSDPFIPFEAFEKGPRNL